MIADVLELASHPVFCFSIALANSALPASSDGLRAQTATQPVYKLRGVEGGSCLQLDVFTNRKLIFILHLTFTFIFKWHVFINIYK